MASTNTATTIELQPQHHHQRHISLSPSPSLSEDLEPLHLAPPSNAQPALVPVTRRRQIAVLLAAFFDVFLTIGINQAYGVFLAYYLSTTALTSSDDGGAGVDDAFLAPGQAENKAMLAFVGTLGAGLTWGGSIFVNPLMARTKDLRRVTGAGALLMGLGYACAGSCSRVWQLLLTQGLLYGVGSSLMYFPVLAIAPEYFDAHRGSAMGFVLSAAGMGGLTFATTIRVCLARVGAAWTLRIFGLVIFFIGLLVALATPPPRVVTRRPTLVNWQLAKKPTFILMAIGAMAQAGGNFVPITFIPEFTTRLGYSAAFGAALLAILNAVNTVSRIGMGFLADQAGRQNTLVVSVLFSAISVLAFWLTSVNGQSSGLWITFVITYGIFSGGYNSLFPTSVMEVFGTQAYASVNGFLYFIRGIGAAWGSPVGGALVEDGAQTQAYIAVIWYDFALLIAASVCVMLVRGFDALDKGVWKLKA